jgi:hypothetical protein
MNAKLRFHTYVTGVLALCAVSLVGCQSAKQPGSSSHAAVTVKGRSDAEIRQVTKVVFAEEGYSLTGEDVEFMVFERPGNRRDAIKWGGWTGEGVVVRAKVKMTKLADNSRLLQLDMFAVRGAGNSFTESENRMALMNKQPYRHLLKEVSKRLQAQ